MADELFQSPPINRMGGLTEDQIMRRIEHSERNSMQFLTDSLKPLTDTVSSLVRRMEKLMGDGEGDEGVLARRLAELQREMREGFSKQRTDTEAIRATGEERHRMNSERLDAMATQVLDTNAKITELSNRTEKIERSQGDVAKAATIVASSKEDLDQKHTVADAALDLISDTVARGKVENLILAIFRPVWAGLKKHTLAVLTATIIQILTLAAVALIAARQNYNRAHPHAFILPVPEPTETTPSAESIPAQPQKRLPASDLPTVSR